MADQRVADERLTETEANLLQIAGIGTQHGNLTPTESSGQYQTIEAIVFNLPCPDTLEGLIEPSAGLHEIDLARVNQQEVMQ